MKMLWKTRVFTVVLTAVLLISGAALALSTGNGSEDRPLTMGTFSNVAEQAIPAVVSINVTRTVGGTRLMRPDKDMNKEEMKEYFEKRGMPFDENSPLPFPFMFPFFEEGEIEVPTAGSGVIIREDGYLVTNYHVIANASEGDITIRLDDDTTYEGDDVEIVGKDSFTDLAVLKIEADRDFPYLEFANSDELDIGEWVLALGSPLELKGSVSQGIISAKHRVIGKAVIEDLVQTTAVINPGNSGGPLVNMNGEIIGINTAIASNTGRWQGVGFAIPSAKVEEVSDAIIESGKAKHGWLGIQMSEINPSLRSYYDLEDVEGIVVAKVFEDSPAEEGGIEAYDVITSVNGTRIDNRMAMLQEIAGKAAGEEVDITLLRYDGDEMKEHELIITLGERPSEKELDMEREEGEQKEEPETGYEDLGIRFREKEEDKEPGLVIDAIKSESSAQKAGLRPGDRIMELNRKGINSVKDFRDSLEQAKKDRDHIVMFKRGNEIMFSTIEK